MTEYNESNIDKLTEKVVNDMDHKEIFMFAFDTLKDVYEKDKEAFLEDWNNKFGDDSYD